MNSSKPPSGYQKRPLAGCGCPNCGYQGWDAFVALGLDADRRARAWFWCPACNNEFVLVKKPWLWLGLRIFCVQVALFSVLYSIIMLVQRQAIPWAIVGAIIFAALCAIFVGSMVLRSPSSFRARGKP